MPLFKEVLEKSCEDITKRDDTVTGLCYFDNVKQRQFDRDDLSKDVTQDNVAHFSDKYDIPHSTLKEKVTQIEKFGGFG